MSQGPARGSASSEPIGKRTVWAPMRGRRTGWFIYCRFARVFHSGGRCSNVRISRGKKVFKSFDNLPDPEQRADSAEQEEDDMLIGDDPSLAFLKGSDGKIDVGLNPKKIKPRRLFPSRTSTRIAEAENAVKGKGKGKAKMLALEEVDEEAETEVETEVDEAHASQIIITHSKKSHSAKRSVSRMTPDSEDDEIVAGPVSSFKEKLGGRKGRLSGSKALFDEGEDDPFGASEPVARKSLFDVGEDDPFGPSEPVVSGFSSDEEKRGTKRRGVDIGLKTPQTGKKRARRAVF